MKAMYEIEIHRNAEGSTLAYFSKVGGCGGYRMAGPKAWGGSSLLAKIEVSESDLARAIESEAPEVLRLLTATAQEGKDE